MATGLLGRMNWYELSTSSASAAQRFYAAVMGWRAQPFEGMDSPYTVLMRGDVPVGGVMDLTEEDVAARVPPHWAMYVATPDVLHTCRHAESLGARLLVPPTMIPEVGRFAVIADPQGAVCSIMQPARPPGLAEAPPAIGDVSWHELVTTDVAAASAFYATLFGWEPAGEHDMGPGGPYRMFGRNGRALGGMYLRPADATAPPNWLVYFRVANASAAAAVVKVKGGKVLNGPMDVPGGGRIAQCLDPQGAAFALHEQA